MNNLEASRRPWTELLGDIDDALCQTSADPPWCRRFALGCLLARSEFPVGRYCPIGELLQAQLGLRLLRTELGITMNACYVLHLSTFRLAFEFYSRWMPPSGHQYRLLQGLHAHRIGRMRELFRRASFATMALLQEEFMQKAPCFAVYSRVRRVLTDVHGLADATRHRIEHDVTIPLARNLGHNHIVDSLVDELDLRPQRPFHHQTLFLHFAFFNATSFVYWDETLQGSVGDDWLYHLRMSLQSLLNVQHFVSTLQDYRPLLTEVSIHHPPHSLPLCLMMCPSDHGLQAELSYFTDAKAMYVVVSDCIIPGSLTKLEGFLQGIAKTPINLSTLHQMLSTFVLYSM
jgi:hypothetical protein